LHNSLTSDSINKDAKPKHMFDEKKIDLHLHMLSKAINHSYRLQFVKSLFDNEKIVDRMKIENRWMIFWSGNWEIFHIWNVQNMLNQNKYSCLTKSNEVMSHSSAYKTEKLRHKHEQKLVETLVTLLA